MWFFLDQRNNLITDTDIKFRQVDEGTKITRPRSKKNIRNESRLEALERRLTSKEVNARQFLRAASFHSYSESSSTSRFEDPPDYSSDEESDVGEEERCSVCLGGRGLIQP